MFRGHFWNIISFLTNELYSPVVNVLPEPSALWSETTRPLPFSSNLSRARSGDLWPVTRPYRSLFWGAGKVREPSALGF